MKTSVAGPSRPRNAAAISVRSRGGTVKRAESTVTRTRGESCSGNTERAWIGWHCEKRNGCPESVCAGSSHCSALACGEVA